MDLSTLSVQEKDIVKRAIRIIERVKGRSYSISIPELQREINNIKHS